MGEQRLKILVISQGLAGQRGGAESSMLTLIKHLARIHNVSVVNGEHGTADSPPLPQNVCVKRVYLGGPLVRSRWLKSLQVRIFGFLAALRLHRHARRQEILFAPELIICQKPPLPYVSRKVPVVAFVRDLGSINYFGLGPARTAEDILDRLLQHILRKIILYSLARSHVVISNSHYMQGVLERYGVVSQVIPPFIELAEGDTDSGTSDGLVLYLSALLAPHKGVTVFTELARQLPHRRFLVVGRDTHGYVALFPKNVEWIPWLEKPALAYQRASIIIVPSQWPETFGRVVVEAQAYGIPVIASAIGGLPEAVGDGGELITRPDAIIEWREAIERLMDDRSRYNQLSAAARVNAAEFDSERVLARFDPLILQRS